MILNRYFILVSIVLLPLVVFAVDPSSEEFPGKLDSLGEAIQKATHDLEIFESNGFNIKTYKTNEIGPPPEFRIEKHIYSAVRIKGEQTPTITIGLNRHNKNSCGLAAFHSQTNEPMISLGDKDGDGKFDDLIYTVMDDNGKALMQITDYGMDGSLNIRLHFDPAYAEIHYQNKWCKIEKKGDERGIYIDGAFRSLKSDGHRPYIE